jgi:thiol-disulfide isomerase/thioredoxin
MKVYHLPSEKLTSIGDGENPLELFLGNLLDDPEAMGPTVKSESLSSNGNIVNTTLSSGIKLATGITFQSLVLSSQKHSIVYFYAPTCGHCKRFDTTWHNLSHLIKVMNWDSELDVVKVDISKNEIFLNANMDSIPAVLFFPKGRKDRPQEMILVDDLISKTGSGENMQDRKERVENNLGGLSDVTSMVKWVLQMLGSDELKAWKRLAGSFRFR